MITRNLTMTGAIEKVLMDDNVDLDGILNFLDFSIFCTKPPARQLSGRTGINTFIKN